MQESILGKHKLTEWSGLVEPLPRTRRVKVRPLEGNEKLLVVTVDPSRQPASLPRELYLREAGLVDLDNVAAVIAFVEEFGALTDPAYGMVDLVGPMEDADIPATLKTLSQTVRATITRAIKSGAVPDDTTWAHRSVVHVDELVVRLRVLRDMTNVWDCLTGEFPWEELHGWWEGGIDPMPESATEGAALLQRRLNAALTPFHPQLVKPEEAGVVPAYSLMASQLYFHVAQGDFYRRCPECGQRFVTHRGTAEGKYHNKGIRFCSKRCTDVAANREYRRRQRARALLAGGLSIPQIAEKMNDTTAEVRRWLKGVPTKG